MNYEQKYKEVLERAQKELQTCGSADCDAAKQIFRFFPELKESEDEKIRKEIIQSIKDNMCVIHKDKCLVWLEKQGEQKPIDKVEPKFKIGDWITNGEYTWKVTDTKPLDYTIQSPNGDEIDDTISYVDEHFHLWTIQDAKDGDVLFTTCNNSNEMVFIYHGIEFDVFNCYFLYSHTRNEHKIFNSACSVKADIYTATKEQRDLLFQKMKEAGYEWDAEKKELKKVEPKPAWSEEDEKKLQDVIYWFEIFCEKNQTKPEMKESLDWLKSFKDRVQPNHWKPSEYDISLLEEIARNIRNNVRPFCSEVSSLEDLIKNLKTL